MVFQIIAFLTCDTNCDTRCDTLPYPKYMSRRGDTWQFCRRVPKELVQIVGVKVWRSTLGTDSRVQAEQNLRIKMVETDKIIEAARNGTFQKIDDSKLEDIAVDWSFWYEQAAEWTLPEAVFGNRFPGVFKHLGQPLSGEIANPIFQSRDQLAGAVKQFVSDTDVKITIPSPEWERLVTFCQDEYAASNPEIAGNKYLGSIGRVEKPAKRRLSKAFERYKSERTRKDSDSPITVGSIEEFKVGVDRFIELYGDLDVNKINRTHAQDFRDTLRKLPARPPNAVRELSLRDQVSWAEENNHRLLAKDTVAKLVGGLKSILDYCANSSDFIVDMKSWMNPFIGFTATGRRKHDPIRRPFTDEEILQVFDPDTFNSYRPSEFWVPLLLYYTGARRNEIAQLHLADIVLDAPTPHLNLTESIAADENDDFDASLSKRIKNWSSDRVAPLVGPMIEIGFPAYVEHARSLGSPHLFSDIPHQKLERRADKLSQSFTRYLRNKAMVTDELVVLHSLRHSFAMGCTKVGVADDDRKLAMGHYLEKEASVENYLIHLRHDPGLMKMKVHDLIAVAPLEIPMLAQRAAEVIEAGPWRPRSRRRTRMSKKPMAV